MVRLAARSELAAIALTDHDTVGGVAEAREAGQRLGVEVIVGCEFSVDGGSGELHLLGYFLPEADPRLVTQLSRFRDLRADRGRAMVAAVRKLGFPVEDADVEREAGGGAIGRPHVARALMARRVVRTIEEAFDRFLAAGRPAYVPKVLPPIAEVTTLIRTVGGVSSLAHPKDRATRALLTLLREQGLDGVEVRHPSHSAPVRAQIEQLALELGLLRTGGSDSHGESAATRTHHVIGGERVPMDWVDAAAALARSRR